MNDLVNQVSGEDKDARNELGWIEDGSGEGYSMHTYITLRGITICSVNET